jgi:hypothetical protein
MKVRLGAEEYFIHASLRARTPTCCADLLRRRLWVPLARRTGDRPRNTVCLRGHALPTVVACPASSRAHNARAGARIFDKRRPIGRPDRAFRSRRRREGGTPRVRDHAGERENLASRCPADAGWKGGRSEPAAAEHSAASASAASASAAPVTTQSSAAATPATPSAPSATTQSAAATAHARSGGRHDS